MKRFLLLAALILAAPASARVPSSKAATPVATGCRQISFPLSASSATMALPSGM